jgi:hypothetical protein
LPRQPHKMCPLSKQREATSICSPYRLDPSSLSFIGISTLTLQD